MIESDQLVAVAGAQVSQWDSEALGTKVTRLGPMIACERTNSSAFKGEFILRSLVRYLEAEAREQRIRVLFARVDGRDIELVRTLELEGYILADSIVTLHMTIDAEGKLVRNIAACTGQAGVAMLQPKGIPEVLHHDQRAILSTRGIVSVRPFQPYDVQALRHIARCAFRHDHFHSDPLIHQSAADEVYVRWLQNSCDGRADTILVAEEPGNSPNPSGFITCRIDKTITTLTGIPHGVIELVAVSPEAQGKGVGTALVLRSLGWFAQQGVSSVEVGTQTRNLHAVRLYQKVGFRCVAFSHTFHKWLVG
ncbi:MAG: GNAT family N-acetyltransferase [Firmicutes bacterium]|nr:GNAT family N-acetyltransferase [Bacillota bacterium]